MTGSAVNIFPFNLKYTGGVVTGGACTQSCTDRVVPKTCTGIRYRIKETCWCPGNTCSIKSVAPGGPSKAVSGTYHMKQGETIIKQVLNPAKTYAAKNVNGYSVASGIDAEDYRYSHLKRSIGGSLNVTESAVTLVEIYGGEAAKTGTRTSGVGGCVSPCGTRPGFPNSAGNSSQMHCGANGATGSYKVFNGDFGDSTNTSKTPGMWIELDEFEYKVGCHGQAGGVNASLLPTANSRNFKFQVGKGGGDNQDGTDTYFSWVTAKGGKGAFKGCTSNTTDVNKAQVANNGQRKNSLGIAGLSDGGEAGDVDIIDKTGVNNKPGRLYERFPNMMDDLDPAGRWKVLPAGKGLDGMIVVSW